MNKSELEFSQHQHTLAHLQCPACEYERVKALESVSLHVLPFRRASELWLEQHKRYIKPNTLRGYVFANKVLNAYFGDLIVRENDSTLAVVFGHGGNFSATLDTTALNGSNGFTITASKGSFGYDHYLTVTSAGDFNGDGFDDILVGASNYNEAYLIYGGAGGFPAWLAAAVYFAV